MRKWTSDLDKKIRFQRERAEEIMEIKDKQERYEALVEFITPYHDEECRWNVAAIADIANEYISAKDYEEFMEDQFPDKSDRWASGQRSALGELLLNNGWGWVVGLR